METLKHKNPLLPTNANPEVDAGIFASTHNQETSCWYFGFMHSSKKKTQKTQTEKKTPNKKTCGILISDPLRLMSSNLL